MSNLNANYVDRLTSVAKGVLGICPFIGPIAAEAIENIIPNQRLDRVTNYLRNLDKTVHDMGSRMERLESNLKLPEGVDIFEEGIIQAARSVSYERQEKLAHIVGKSLSGEELKYSESRKILNIFRELTDQEILWLLYFSKPHTMGSKFHNELMKKYPEVLSPASHAASAPQKEIDRGALQDSYKNTLLRLGLIKTRDSSSSFEISALGSLLVRYIETQIDDSES